MRRASPPARVVTAASDHDRAAESRTKVDLSRAEIEALARAAFGARATILEVSPAREGWYNAGYALSLGGAGPERCFLKVAPPDDIPVLTYERQLMRAEAFVLQALAKAEVASVPTTLAADFDRRIVERDCLFLSFIEGELFSLARAGMDEADRIRIRGDIGRVCGAANRIVGAVFGYPAQPKLLAPSWRDAFEAMIAHLLADARRYAAPLEPPRLDAIAAAFADASAALLDEVRPQLVHFDLWDGNVLVRRGATGWEMSGVIDWERAFFGDPLADVVNLAMTGSPAEREAVLQGLAGGYGEALAPGDARAERRLALYRAYLWLIMIVEAGPRGFGGSIRLPGSSAERRLDRDLAVAAG